MEKNKIENISLLILFVGISILLFFVFAPFLTVLSLAVFFAILLYTPYTKLTRFFGGWESLAALSTVGLMLVFCIAPLFFLGAQIVQQAQNLYGGMHGNETQYIQILEKAIEIPVQKFSPGFVFDLNTYVGNGLVFISNNLGSFTYQTLTVLFYTFLMLMALFFFLRDGKKLTRALEELSPLGGTVTTEIVDKAYQTTKSVVRGTMGIILIRWACIWATLALFGIPNALLWGSVGALVGAIPGLGTAITYIVAVTYFYLLGNIPSAIALAFVGVGIVILIDNILTSYFFGKGLEVPSIFVLFSILGGIVFFGPLGFILGPLVLSVFLSIVRVYGKRETRSRAAKKEVIA